jgi:hypothetical protein
MLDPNARTIELGNPVSVGQKHLNAQELPALVQEAKIKDWLAKISMSKYLEHFREIKDWLARAADVTNQTPFAR